MRRAPGLIAVPLTALALAGCGSTPSTMTVKGTVTVPDNPAAGDTSAVRYGTQLTVTDPSGKIIGFTTLTDNADQGRTFTLTYAFNVKVPEGEPSYGIAIQSVPGTERYTQAQMKQGPALCVGDACQ